MSYEQLLVLVAVALIAIQLVVSAYAAMLWKKMPEERGWIGPHLAVYLIGCSWMAAAFFLVTTPSKIYILIVSALLIFGMLRSLSRVWPPKEDDS